VLVIAVLATRPAALVGLLKEKGVLQLHAADQKLPIVPCDRHTSAAPGTTPS
jgi:hypothetical protein